MTQTAVDLDELEMMLRTDARAALSEARELLDGSGYQPDSVTYQRLLLVKGAAQAQLGDTEDGARIMREVRAWAEPRGETQLLAQSHRRLSALFRRIGDPALMLEHAVAAVDLLDESADVATRADLLLGLADALGAGGSFEDSIQRYREAARLADQSDRRYLQLAVKNNLAFTLYEAGRAAEAVAIAEELQRETRRDGQPMMRHNGDTIARALMAVGRYDDAAEVLVPLCEGVDDDETGEDCDGLVLALLALAEVRRRAGGFAQAQRSLDRASALAARYALNGRVIELLREQAELYAAQGLYKDAFETFRDFHLADVELRAVERDSRARTLNAIFEATEARRSSDYFRELSVRDPLTGLHNRRHLDARLEELLDDSGTVPSFTVGLLDLDHFKRINDTRSHAVGDEVLRTVAALLQAAADDVDGGIAARIGGEEFLVLLPGVEPADGWARLERLRRTIAEHGWDGVTDGLPVTASVGVASAPVDSVEKSTLMGIADRHLYDAKRAGRDRVVAS